MKIQPNLWHIKEVFEIRLNTNLWARIKTVAEQEELTYTWVVRMCLFRMLQARCDWTEELWRAKAQAKRMHWRRFDGSKPPQHRHMLCLYGEDQKLVRIWAMQLGISISDIVRMSILCHLADIENGFTSRNELVSSGTKRLDRIHFVQEPSNPPTIIFAHLRYFQDFEYWPISRQMLTDPARGQPRLAS